MTKYNTFRIKTAFLQVWEKVGLFTLFMLNDFYFLLE